MRITTVRIIVQAIMFGLFLSFVLLTTFANLDRFPNLRHWVSKLLEIDPLVSIATAITTHTVYKGLLWSLVVLIPTLFLGRFFCDWICPYGILHHFVGWLFGHRGPEQRQEANRYRPIQRVKYYILTAMLVAAVFGTLQIGLLDPICLIYRSFTGAVIPAVQMPAAGILGDYRLHQGAWLIGGLLFGLVAMNLVIPRFFCRVLCPLGALLGVLSRFAWWRIERDPDKCTNCNQCVQNCEGACDPHQRLRKAECFVCFNCIEDCPHGALRFAFMPPKSHAVAGTDMSRRKAIFAGLTGLLFFPFARTTGAATRNFSSKLVRPPGSVEEIKFLKRCLKCDQCIRVCPTNVLQPDWFEGGIEGLWAPVLNFRMGHCQLNCTACGQVCPSGAIQRITLDEKLGLGEFAERGPIRVGTAHIDTGRCLPYSTNVPCVVCEEVCPTSPKAIYTERQMHVVRNGRMVVSSAVENTVFLLEPSGEPARFTTDQWKDDGTTTYYLTVDHADGSAETHRIAGNGADSVTIASRFGRQPVPQAVALVQIECRVPRVDLDLCIGCGICERECPVVGDRRAIYVTADGETRSQACRERDGNRSVRLG